jgi:hypothetical protein
VADLEDVRTRLFVAVSVCSLLTLCGCGSAGTQEVQAIDETLVRTAASTQGQAELAKVGVEVSGPLSCTSTRDGDVVNLTCNGTALDGRQVSVTGAATSLPGGTTVAGHFVGTAGEQQVFALNCLGC